MFSLATSDVSPGGDDRREPTRWTIHGERVIDDTRRLRLSIAQVELPDGVQFEQYVLRIPKRSAPAMLAAYLRSNLEFIRDHSTAIAAVTEIVVNVRSRDGVPRFAGGRGGRRRCSRASRRCCGEGRVDGVFTDFDTRTMAWAIRDLIDGVNRRRALDPEFDFDTCITELIALFDRATRNTG